MSSEIAIKVENLSKCYHIYDRPRDRLLQMLSRGRRQYFREFWSLKEVSFEIKKGEAVGIIGRNGSGKSTLLQMICGTLSPTDGAINVQGRVAALLELGAGFNTEFTGRENILLNAAILGFSSEEISTKMAQIVAFSELGDFLDQPVKTYSSGMYVRLAFSIAIHVDPAVLIVDEALAVGDARFQAKCMRRIKDIKDQGTSILFVSHDVVSVRSLCDRAIWLDKGKVVDQGDVFPVTGRYMEFMLMDAQADESALGDKTPFLQKSYALNGGPKTQGGEESSSVVSMEKIPGIDLDARPVTHWGSHKGIILSAAVCDAQGNRKETFSLGDVVLVVVDLHIPHEIQRDYLSIAISIKDVKGTDLIVSTTHDSSSIRLPDEERFRISFRFDNLLVTGMYLLVAAVEDRQYSDIHYYEYIEGACYFSSLADKRFFGIFQPHVEQQVYEIK